MIARVSCETRAVVLESLANPRKRYQEMSTINVVKAEG